MIPEEYVRCDTDGLLYKREETQWVVQPTKDDPGVLQPIIGAVPYECKPDPEDDR